MIYSNNIDLVQPVGTPVNNQIKNLNQIIIIVYGHYINFIIMKIS